MDAKERLVKAADRIVVAAKEFFNDLVLADDRTPNWEVHGKVVKEKLWRKVNGPTSRDDREDQ